MNTIEPTRLPEPVPLETGWRPSALRLIVIYGVFFLAWSIVLVGAIRWQTTQFLDGVVGEIIGRLKQKGLRIEESQAVVSRA